MLTTADSPPSSMAAITLTGTCSSPSSTTEQQRDTTGSPKQETYCAKGLNLDRYGGNRHPPCPTSGSPKQESYCAKRLSIEKYGSRHQPYPEGAARSPGSCSSDGDSVQSESEESSTHSGGHSKVKRVAANSRERKRMHTVNSAFDQLRELVPTYPSNRKLSKIDTLRLACTYIQDLVSLLHSTQSVQGEDVLYHQPYAPTPESFNGYPVTVKQEMVDYPTYGSQEHYRMQQSCLRFVPVSFAL